MREKTTLPNKMKKLLKIDRKGPKKWIKICKNGLKRSLMVARGQKWHLRAFKNRFKSVKNGIKVEELGDKIVQNDKICLNR